MFVFAVSPGANNSAAAQHTYLFQFPVRSSTNEETKELAQKFKFNQYYTHRIVTQTTERQLNSAKTKDIGGAKKILQTESQEPRSIDMQQTQNVRGVEVFV